MRHVGNENIEECAVSYLQQHGMGTARDIGFFLRKTTRSTAMLLRGKNINNKVVRGKVFYFL